MSTHTNLRISSIICLLLVFLLVPPSWSITVEYASCERVNFTTVYPLVLSPQIRYYLFTAAAADPNEGEELFDQNVPSVQESKFNAEWPVRIFISGYKTTPQNCKSALIKDAYMKLGNINFILVDWSDWNKREYGLAALSVRHVGTLLGNFTKFLNQNFDIAYTDMYLIGHSLGAHVAGAAGQSISPDKYEKIYGLDPSGPGFVGTLPAYRLDPTDGKNVEVISTDMYGFGYGSAAPIGHAVFYPHNGRRVQPFCPQALSLDIRDQLCSHAAAADYFANSLNPDVEFCGVPTTWSDVFLQRIPKNDGTCDVKMGGEPAVEKTGHYYVFVSETAPMPE